jgi:tetratricopeptide (TPR) repeat protein
LELAHFRQGEEAYEMIEEAIKKFDKALVLDARRHDALWCLGNAYTSQGFLSESAHKASEFFIKAGDAFKRAVEHEPENESYRRALEMSTKAPQLYQELQRQLQAAGAGGPSGSPRSEGAGGSSSGGRTGQGQRGAGASEFWYDMAGWVVLVGLGVGIAALSRSSAAPTAPK